MRSNNLQLPCVQPPTASCYLQLADEELQLPHGCHGHADHGGQDRQETGETFKLYSLGNLWLAAFAILAMFLYKITLLAIDIDNIGCLQFLPL